MKKNTDNFKFTVTDEIIDLRKLDQRDSLKPSEIHKTSSRAKTTNKLQASKTEIQAADQKLLSNSLHNLANHLTASEKTLKPRNAPILQRNTVRRRQINRAASADPRFRKTRSPERKASASASAATLGSQPMQNKSVRPSSASTPAFKKNHYNQYYTTMSEESHSKSDLTGSKSNVVRKHADPSTNNSSIDCNTDGNTSIKQNRSENTMDEELHSSQFKTTIPSREDLKPISPYWDDPRLLHKYSGLLQLSQLKRSKSTWTLPISTSRQVLPLEKNVCSHNIETETYKYDEGTDAASLSAILIQKQTFAETVKKHFCLVLYFSLSSCIGILLAALCIWTFLNYVFPLLKPEEQSHKYDISDNVIVRLVGYVTGVTINILRTVFRQLVRLLYVQHSEVYGIKEQAYEPWILKVFREVMY